MALEVKRRLFTVDDYRQMAAAGILGEDDRVELIEGEIVEMTPIGGEHIGSINNLTMLFARGLAEAIVQIQSPIRLDERNEPQPDVVLLRAGTRHLPAYPRDVLLVIEVADSSLRYDQTVKLPLYARAGISEVWIADVGARVVLMHRDPAADGYQTIATARGEDRLSPIAFPEFSLTAEMIFG